MSERPILFSGPMVRALLAGAKAQTRRALAVRGGGHLNGWEFVRVQDGYPDGAVRAVFECFAGAEPDDTIGVRCPYGGPGDRLWVREAHRFRADEDDKRVADLWVKSRPWYAADPDSEPSGCGGGAGKLRPGIHMPRWASRLTLEVTGVRVERLQQITDADIEAEGIRHHDDARAVLDAGGTLREAWAAGWDSINGGRASWASDPWVWVVAFRRLEAPAP